MCEKYEMHVYTMGTRAYAEAVCAAIDPGGAVFRGRILSRDESGSAWCPTHNISATG
jgi:RNA polymerase II subunit A C-terminal domain phosphatase